MGMFISCKEAISVGVIADQSGMHAESQAWQSAFLSNSVG
jgi:hypothetical protein